MNDLNVIKNEIESKIKTLQEEFQKQISGLNAILCENGFEITNFVPPWSILKVSTVNISSSQLLSLHSIPVSILPPPGSGIMHNVFSVIVEFVPNTTPYVVDVLGFLEFQYATNGDDVTNHISGIGLLDQKAKAISTADMETISGLGQLSVANSGICLTTSADNNFMRGDGSLIVTVFYATLSV
jgi:hypothetical protein